MGTTVYNSLKYQYADPWVCMPMNFCKHEEDKWNNVKLISISAGDGPVPKAGGLEGVTIDLALTTNLRMNQE